MRIIAFIGLALACGLARAGEVVVRAVGDQAGVGAFGRVEWSVELGRTYDNPFNPDEIAVDALFTPVPGKISLSVPGFWYQPHERVKDGRRESIRPAGEGQWRVRFCPPSAGRWRMVVTAKDAAGMRTSAPVEFTVAESKHPGFVRISPRNPRYFEMDSGAAYFVLGPNIGWGGNGGLGNYEAWLGRLSAAGGNFARVWMASPNVATETKAAGLGRYDLAACWFYDQVLELAEKNDIRCMLALNTYGDLLTGGHFGEGRWPISPYNKANGGPATQPADFIAMRECRDLYKRRLRYLVGRYSAYTSLAFWEFWNEQDNLGSIVTTDWVAEMSGHLRGLDPYRRPITTSFSGAGVPAVWKLPEIDLTQRHLYGDAPMFNPTPQVAALVREHLEYDKPHLVGEIGISWRSSDEGFDRKGMGTTMHNALWAAALGGSAGGAAHWYWDNYIHPRDLWGTYTGLAKFAASVDWPAYRLKPLKVLSPVREGGEETFGDVALRADGTWRRAPGRALVLERDGSMSGVVPGFLFGPVKQEMRTTLRIEVDLPRASRMTVRVAKVSDQAAIRVAVDGDEVARWPFRAKPGEPGQKSTRQDPRWGGWQAEFDVDRAVEIAAGKHTITLDNMAGDWVSIASITFAGAVSSRYTGLRPLALGDAEKGLALMWLADPESHSGNDTEGVPPRRMEGIVMTLPAREGAYEVQWWDTRKGTIIGTEKARAKDGELMVRPPAFERDIAMRAVRR